MAPADRSGYQLLPQDDLSAAGGPVRVEKTTDGEADEDAVEKGPEKAEEDVHDSGDGHVKYDGARRYDLSATSWVIHPYHVYVQKWYYLLGGLLMCDSVYLPLETAFGKYMPQEMIFCCDLTCTLLFSFDIVLQFFLQIPSAGGDFWVFNHERIIKSYLHGNFGVDLIGVLPFSEIHVIINRIPSMRESSLSYMLHVLRFTKLVRFLRLRRILQRHIYDFNLSNMQRAVIFSTAVIVCSLHVMGCIWATLGNYQPGETWITELRWQKDMHLHGSGEWLEEHNDDLESSVVTYVMSIYFALYTLTGIGYGDINPTTATEFITLILLMLVGSIIWATIIGEIVNVLRHAEFDNADHYQTMDKLFELAKQYKFGSDLRVRLSQYLTQSRSISRSNYVREQVFPFMSQELAVQLCQVMHGHWFDKIWWLKSVGRSQFMVQLTLAFDPMLYAPKEYIKTTERMYVIQRGLCIHGATIMSKDQCFGMDMLLTQEHLRINLTTLAISYLHVMYLTRGALQRTLERFPREQSLVKRSYRTLCLFRGLTYKARQMIAEEKRLERLAQKEARSGRSEDFPRSLSPVGRPMGLFESMGSAQVNCGAVLVPSQALERKAEEKDVVEAIVETTDRLQSLETNLGHRIEVVDEQLRDALDVITSFVRRKKGLDK